MVIAQPHLCLTPNEPFTCLPERKGQQLAAVRKTLAIAEAGHRGSKTHFTIFPEYSIPGLDGFASIDETVAGNGWPIGTIIIGGIDALTKAQFAELAGKPRTHLDTEHNSLTRIGPGEWVNCSVTWVKCADGTVDRWLQPKLAPAWPEKNILYEEMFRGHSIFTFKGALENDATYRFSSLLCFDWISDVANKKAWYWALEDLQQQAAAQGNGDLSLSWFFVIQCNQFPSHPTFLTQVPAFFKATTFSRVRRERTCLIFANSAGRAVPGRTDGFGGTSLIFSPSTLFREETSRPTVSKGGERYRKNTILGGHRDAYFREQGACIHAFLQVNPDQAGGADARTFAIEHPYVFPFDGVNDPRAPGDRVPACVKWLNDELDDVEGLGTLHPGCVLAPQVIAAHEFAVTGLRQLDAKSTCRVVTLSTPKSAIVRDAAPEDADQWQQGHIEALNHVVHTISILQLAAGAFIANADRGHATVTIKGQTIDLVAVRGKSHQECSEHTKDFAGGARRKVLFVSRDRDNTPLSKRERNILTPKGKGAGDEQQFTAPESGRITIDYHSLLEIFRTSPTQAAMRGALDAQLAAA